jgi:hypothetical protein
METEEKIGNKTTKTQKQRERERPREKEIAARGRRIGGFRRRGGVAAVVGRSFFLRSSVSSFHSYSNSVHLSSSFCFPFLFLWVVCDFMIMNGEFFDD